MSIGAIWDPVRVRPSGVPDSRWFLLPSLVSLSRLSAMPTLKCERILLPGRGGPNLICIVIPEKRGRAGSRVGSASALSPVYGKAKPSRYKKSTTRHCSRNMLGISDGKSLKM